MKEIKLKLIEHRGKKCIGLYFENYSSLNNLVRRNAGAYWSQTKKCCYLPWNKESYNILSKAVAGKAILNTSELKKMQPVKKISAAPVVNTIAEISDNKLIRNITNPNGLKVHANIASINQHILPQMEQELKLKAYSPSTIRTYLNEMVQLLGMLKEIPADKLMPEQLMRYLVYCYEKLLLKENTLHSRINAMKFYYEQVLATKIFFANTRRKNILINLIQDVLS